MPDLHWLSLAEAARLIESREVSPVELTEAALERTAAVDGELNAFIALLAETALTEASAAADEIAAGGYRGPLHGIPVGLKDIFDVAGARTTAASKAPVGHRPESDSECAKRLREAGAIILGKLNLHEIALGATGIVSSHGPARNPWDTTRITGGSSSGSGAAVASGELLAALGTDTGGSIRIPAALCGIVGIKPTFGRVSRRGLMPLSWSLDHAGPLTRTVEDAAIVLQAIAGHDPGDPASSGVEVHDYTSRIGDGVKGMRVGVGSRWFSDDLPEEIAANFREAVGVLESLGAEVREVDPPHIDEVAGAVACIMLPEAFTYHAPWLRDHADKYSEEVRFRLELGATYSADQYINSLRFREMVVEAWRQVFSQIDIVATPATMAAAGPIERSDLSTTYSLIRFTNPFNFLGTPAISVPSGFTSEGLPLGLHLTAHWFDEARVLRAAYAYEQATDWHTRRPPL
ncbi:MAG TPA: amidase [Dehalococcoidia bacterium]|nr:amidase [Dehalococcoidia bacterium]